MTPSAVLAADGASTSPSRSSVSLASGTRAASPAVSPWGGAGVIGGVGREGGGTIDTPILHIDVRNRFAEPAMWFFL